jgi:O-antigen/teichoic acid export membrane protein
MCFVLSLWIKEIFLVFFKQNELRSAYPLAVIIIMSYTYFPMYWHVINKLQFNNLTTSLWKITTLGGIINIVLNLILMPFFGYKVATITTMISLLYISVAGFLLPEFRQKNKSNFSPTKWILLIVLLTIISYIFKDTSLLIKCTITILSLILSVRFIYKLQYGGYNV